MIRRYLCKEIDHTVLGQAVRDFRLDIDLRADGHYELRVAAPAGALTPAQEQVVAEMPSHHAVDPPERTASGLLIKGFDVECLPAMVTELTGAGLLTDFS